MSNEIFSKEEKYDSSGNLIYRRIGSFEYWCEYDENGNEVHSKTSDGLEEWHKYDSNGKLIHSKDSEGAEEWYEYDCDGNLMRYKKHTEEKEYDRINDCTHYIITDIEETVYGGK